MTMSQSSQLAMLTTSYLANSNSSVVEFATAVYLIKITHTHIVESVHMLFQSQITKKGWLKKFEREQRLTFRTVYSAGKIYAEPAE